MSVLTWSRHEVLCPRTPLTSNLQPMLKVFFVYFEWHTVLLDKVGNIGIILFLLYYFHKEEKLHHLFISILVNFRTIGWKMNTSVLIHLQWLHLDATILDTVPRKSGKKKITSGQRLTVLSDLCHWLTTVTWYNQDAGNKKEKEKPANIAESRKLFSIAK